MSQLHQTNFKWLPAASGAPKIPKFTLDPLPALSVEASTLYSVSLPVGTGKVPPSKTVHIPVTSTVLQDPVANSPAISLTHQTKPLDFIAPVCPTKVVKSVPEMTLEVFKFYTPSVDASVSVLAEATPSKSNSGLPPDASSTDASTASFSYNAGAKVAGTIIGIVFVMLVLPLVFRYWRARRRTTKANEPAPVDMEAVLKEKRERAEHLAKQRWSHYHIGQSLDRYQAMQASLVADALKKKDPAVQTEDATFEIQNPQVRHDRARRPSALAMHPPTPVVSEHNPRCNQEVSKDVGRAV